jgi:hypothetical protein
VPNGILFEIATDGPGFATDELALSPFLEPRRREIEAALKPLGYRDRLRPRKRAASSRSVSLLALAIRKMS